MSNYKAKTSVNYDKFIINLLIIYAILCPSIYYRANGNAISIVDIILPVAVIVIMHKRFSRIPTVYIYYLLYIFFAMVSVLLSPFGYAEPEKIILVYRLFAISIPFCLVFFISNFTEKIAINIIISALIGTGIPVLIGLFLYYFGVEISDVQQRLWLGGGAGSALRAGGIVGNSGDYGQIIALFSILLITIGYYKIKIPISLLFMCWVCVLLALVASSSRAAMVMIFVFVFCLGLSRINYIGRMFVSISFILLLLLTFYIFFSYEEFAPELKASLIRLDILNFTNLSRFTTTVRLEVWTYLIRNIGDVPIFGYGYKSFTDYHGIYIDNSFLSTYYETGIFGLIFFTLFWLVLLIKLTYLSLNGSRSAAIAGCLVVAFLLRMQTGGAHTLWSSAPIIFILISVLWRLSLYELDMSFSNKKIRYYSTDPYLNDFQK